MKNYLIVLILLTAVATIALRGVVGWCAVSFLFGFWCREVLARATVEALD